MNTSSKLIAACVGALALTATAAFGGYVLGGSSSRAAQIVHDQAYQQAREDFCNLQISTDGNPIRLDYRSIQNLDTNLLIADDACTDDSIRIWNEAQIASDSEVRACRYDWQADIITAAIGSGRCVAPLALN